MAVRTGLSRPAEGKVQPWHRDRLAVVYVRQSTAAQVHDHQESTRLQYGLSERAVALGWAPSRVLVIDEDLGRSAGTFRQRTELTKAARDLFAKLSITPPRQIIELSTPHA